MRGTERSPIHTEVRVGDYGNGNYTAIESDGTIVSRGNATTWGDLTGSLVANRLESVAGKLQYDYNENAIVMQSGGSLGNSTDRLIFNFQYPHGAITNGMMRLHIHWDQTSTNQIEWTTQYRIQNNGVEKTTAWTTAPVTNSVDDSKYPYVSGSINQITELANVDMTGASLSATVQFRVVRTDNTVGDIEATFVNAHIEEDTIGSREEYVK